MKTIDFLDLFKRLQQYMDRHADADQNIDGTFNTNEEMRFAMELEDLISDIEVAKTCPECKGKGEVVYGCCSGEMELNDYMICPICHEHLGEDTCEECNGSGEIKIKIEI